MLRNPTLCLAYNQKEKRNTYLQITILNTKRAKVAGLTDPKGPATEPARGALALICSRFSNNESTPRSHVCVEHGFWHTEHFVAEFWENVAGILGKRENGLGIQRRGKRENGGKTRKRTSKFPLHFPQTGRLKSEANFTLCYKIQTSSNFSDSRVDASLRFTFTGCPSLAYFSRPSSYVMRSKTHWSRGYPPHINCNIGYLITSN